MEKNETEKGMLLGEEEDISVEKQGGIISLLIVLNAYMKAMGETLKRFRGGPNFGNAEPAKKPRKLSEAKTSISTSDRTDPSHSTPETGGGAPSVNNCWVGKTQMKQKTA